MSDRVFERKTLHIDCTGFCTDTAQDCTRHVQYSTGNLYNNFPSRNCTMRAQLASYLAIETSKLATELTRMRRDQGEEIKSVNHGEVISQAV